MAATSTGWLLNSFRSTYKHVTGYNVYPGIFLQTRNYAARKGTREKARKKKVKQVVEKYVFVPPKLRAALSVKGSKVDLRLPRDAKKFEPIDDVWIGKFFKWKTYSFEEAIQCHRETHHPTMYNLPDANVKTLIELDLEGEKKTRVVNAITRVMTIPHTFYHGEERKVLALCKSKELQTIAKDAGASFVGGRELIKQIQAGQFSLKEYDHCVAHSDILSDLLLIRGLLKKDFPNNKAGTLGDDMEQLVKRFVDGIQYSVNPHELQKTYGTIEVVIGTLNMDTKHLEENFSALVKDIESLRPRRKGNFILRTQIFSPPSREGFKVDFKEYLSNKKISKENIGEEEDNTFAVIATH